MEEWNKNAGGKGLLLDSSANLQSKTMSRLRRIRCDCGSEFVNKDFTALLKKNGATLCATNPYVNDGRAEAAIKKIATLTRCCLIEANFWKPFWGPMSDMVVHTLVRTYQPSKRRIPFTALTGIKPDISYCRMPGCIALCHIMDRHRQKLDERAFVGILIGYDTSARSWVFLNPKTGRNVRTVFARFYERKRDPEEHIHQHVLYAVATYII